VKHAISLSQLMKCWLQKT